MFGLLFLLYNGEARGDYRMREIKASTVEQTITELFSDIPFAYPETVRAKMEQAIPCEEERAASVLRLLLENERTARKEAVPLCQDTGLAVVECRIGQDVHIIEGSLEQAIQQGVRNAYRNSYLRFSVVDDPLFERVNTGDNTPALIHYQMVPGSELRLSVMAKGFGSENVSRLAMLKPADGLAGVKAFVLETIRMAGPNACPPMMVGVGIGGAMDTCAWLAKKALLRQEEHHSDQRYAALEQELLQEINELQIGPAGLKGKTTALGVCIETFPTHIAGLPVAVNINCHAVRKGMRML